jgi:hypothetical protein
MKKLKLKLRRETVLNLSDLEAVKGGQVVGSILCSQAGSLCGCIPKTVRVLCETSIALPCG